MPVDSFYLDAPDDDDLINDDMEEDDYGPPMDYDEAHIEEMMGEQNNNEGNQNSNMINAADGLGDAGAEKKSSDIGDTQRDQDGDLIMTEEIDRVSNRTSSIVPMEVTIDMRQDTTNRDIVRKSKDTELYSFERYRDTYEWRTKSAQLQREEEEIMVATQWKRRIKDQKDVAVLQSKRQTSNAPESQLVQFFNNIINNNHGTNYKKPILNGCERYKVTSNLPVSGRESAPITIEGGQMLYIPKAKTNVRFLRCEKGVTASETGLLGIPLAELINRAAALERRNDRRKRLRREREIHTAETTTNTRNDYDIIPEENGDYEVNTTNTNHILNIDQEKKKKIDTNSQLWVDKHSPMIFSDLLSDERTNREVLRALRQWDPFVFQKEPPPRPQIYNRNNIDDKTNPSATSNDRDTYDNHNNKDLRPDEQNRVILLSGPPGVGKTTLAHIIARHAGYRPLEVNASDERSASVLTERVKRAMESTSLNMKQLNGDKDIMMGRPNCLILDEIDGADAKASIQALVEIIRADRPITGNKGKSKKTYLRRPIIFICNHKYAPALRPLLPFSRQFDVLPPSPNRLVSRLKAVLGAEKMTVVSGSQLLHQLVASSGGDIRSCLFTLQFASARARDIHLKKKKDEGVVGNCHSHVVDVSQVLDVVLNGSARGMKDIRGDMAGTLRTIFRKLKLKQIAGAPLKQSCSRDVERILDTVETFSDAPKTLDGLFLNLTNVSYIDPTLDRCWTAHEWLSSVDVYRSHKTSVASTNHAEHNVIQNAYIPTAAAAIHILCRVETNPELTFSLRPLLDTLHQLEVNTGLVNKFLDGLNPKSRSGISSYGFTSEILPFCLHVLSVGDGIGALNRPVSSVDFLTKEEKLTFDAHVEMLRNLGLTYTKVEDSVMQNGTHNLNEIEMRLEPEIDKVFQFQGLEGTKSKKNHIPPVLKELLAHAANMAYLRSKEHQAQQLPKGDAATSSKPVNKQRNQALYSKAMETNTMEVDKSNTPHVPQGEATNVGVTNFLCVGAAKAKAARNARKAAQVGFDRKNKSAKKYSNTGSGVPLEEVIRFKYQKGFTQAVRLPCMKSDFTIL